MDRGSYETEDDKWWHLLTSRLADRGLSIDVEAPDGLLYMYLVGMHATRLLELAELERGRYDSIPELHEVVAKDLVEAWWTACEGKDLDGEAWLVKLQPIMATEVPRLTLFDRIFEMFDRLLRAQCTVAECWRDGARVFRGLESFVGPYPSQPRTEPWEPMIQLFEEDVPVARQLDVPLAKERSIVGAQVISAAFAERESES